MEERSIKMEYVSLTTHTEAVAVIRLERPDKLNALTPAMIDGLETCVREAEGLDGCRAIVISGMGKVFCAGADVRVWRGLSAEDFRKRWIVGGHRAFDAIAGCRLPVVAAVQGIAFGGGLELALAADLRVAETGASFCLPEVGLGTVPGWGGTQRLAAIVGPARAKHMALTAARVDAETALSWGLVTKLTSTSKAVDCALALADKIAAQAPIATQIAKSVIDAGVGQNLGRTLETLAGMVTATTSDVREGTLAMLEKRPPRFAEK